MSPDVAKSDEFYMNIISVLDVKNTFNDADRPLADFLIKKELANSKKKYDALQLLGAEICAKSNMPVNSTMKIQIPVEPTSDNQSTVEKTSMQKLHATINEMILYMDYCQLNQTLENRNNNILSRLEHESKEYDCIQK